MAARGLTLDEFPGSFTVAEVGGPEPLADCASDARR
jgi:hypothetical protein